MDTFYHLLKREFSKILVLFLGVYGLFQSAPGFRPKHLRDIALGFWNERGAGVILCFALFSLLVPAAIRLKKRGFAQTVLGALFVCFSFLLASDLLGDVIIGLSTKTHGIGRWTMRLVYFSLVIWGISHKPSRKDMKAGLMKWHRQIWGGLHPWGWKVFSVLVLFFFLRQELHLYLTRGIPFPPFEDEIPWWHYMGKTILHFGLQEQVHLFPYTPGVPWLISLPARLVGSHREEWLIAYPLFLMVCYLGFVIELAKTPLSFLAGISILFFSFLANRDLFHLYGATLYGESLAALLTALLLAEVYLFWSNQLHLNSRTSLPKKSSLIGFGFFLSFCALSKPPISVLVPFFVYGLTILLLLKKHSTLSMKQKAKGALLFILCAMVPFQIWKTAISIIGHTPEHAFHLDRLLARGIDFSVFGMVLGLLNPGSFQSAYTLGLIFLILIGLHQRNYKFLALIFSAVFIYWGFVLGLYATLWQHVERNSAGRYFSHVAIGCILLLPLAFQMIPQKRQNLK